MQDPQSPRPPIRQLALYAALVAAFFALTGMVLRVGGRLDAPAAARALASAPGAQDPESPLSLLLMQLCAILAACRLCAAGARRLGQPGVVGEILAGILLGPSLLGWLRPGAQAWLFPPASLSKLHLLSQIGLILFLFILGLELNVDVLRRKAHTAVLVSHASIAAPFLLGITLALGLYRGYAPPGVPFRAFGLFLGTAMSVTAFPVLASILRERGLSRTPLGAVALSCAAVDDITAWCALAFVAAMVKGQAASQPWATVLGCALYIWGMLRLVGPWLERRVERGLAAGASDREAAGLILMILLLSALATEALGVHALFGAFLAGIVAPRQEEFRRRLAARLEDLSASVLLPVFFALSGLRTRLDLLAGWPALGALAAILAAAVAGKLGAGALAARASGMAWRESLALGALMNARGLVELVVLNVGYEIGAISASVFAMMVLMALSTTLMAGPLLTLLAPSPGDRSPALSPRPG